MKNISKKYTLFILVLLMCNEILKAKTISIGIVGSLDRYDYHFNDIKSFQHTYENKWNNSLGLKINLKLMLVLII